MAPPKEPTLKPVFVLGLDLGQQQDYSAVAVNRVQWKPKYAHGQTRMMSFHQILYLHRWELKTPYPKIIDEVRDLAARPPLDHPRLGIDQTGVGTAVVDFFRRSPIQAVLCPVLITGGTQTTMVDGCWHCPKGELVSVMDTLLVSDRIEFAQMPLRSLLQREMTTFQRKVTKKANDTFESWRERDHDDIVLAVAIAAWLGERYGCPVDAEVEVPKRDVWKRQAEPVQNFQRRGLFGSRVPR